MGMVDRMDRIRGCLLAGACGDALGAPVEFLSLDEIRRRFGADGIRDFAPAYGRAGAITDDTQMTLFSLEGLLRAHVRAPDGSGSDAVPVIHGAYLRWLLTQGRRPRIEIGKPDGWLFGLGSLHSLRAPGNTCLSALSAATSLGAFAANDSKGCGGVMRAAPFGFFEGAERAFELAADAARLTHGHPSGHLAAGHLGALIALLLEDRGLDDALDGADALLRRRPGHEEVAQALEHARKLAGEGPSTERLVALGQGWIAEEALAMAIYAALAAPSLEAALVLAVNHGGDSDSTGAIAGNILGAVHGTSAIPLRWLEGLELREEIERLATDADRAVTHGLGSARALAAAYPAS
jgi:ADP-ribosyl-[dinitrogen reductase] hydrolase